MKRIPSVLIVDDNPDDCYLATHALEKDGRVDNAWSINEPEAVLTMYRNYQGSCASRPEQFPPTLIILDINMPGMTGFELADALAERQYAEDEIKPVVICMVTSSLHDEDVDRAATHPLVRSYYTKPLTAENVAELVREFGQETT